MGRQLTAPDGTPLARERIIAAVARGVTLQDAAEQNGVSKRTAIRWAKLPGFREEIMELQAQRRKEAEALLQAEINKSLLTLFALRDGEDIESSVRLRAAVEILDRAGLTVTKRSEVDMRVQQDVSDEDIDKELQRVALKLAAG